MQVAHVAQTGRAGEGDPEGGTLVISVERSGATMSCVVYCNIYWERTKLVMQSATEVAEKRRASNFFH